MTYFVDTSFFVALLDKDDDFHERAQEMFVDIMNGNYGKVHTSDYVLDESVTVVRRHTKDHEMAVRVGKMISNSVMINMVQTTSGEVVDALKEYEKNEDKDLSFTDWILVKQIERRGMSGILSFDKHFDEVGVKRIH